MAKITYNSISVNNIADFCVSVDYKATIINPAFNPALPEDATNLRIIPNPETPMAHMERKGREYFDGQIALGKKKARDAVRQTEDATDAAAGKLPVGSIV